MKALSSAKVQGVSLWISKYQ